MTNKFGHYLEEYYSCIRNIVIIYFMACILLAKDISSKDTEECAGIEILTYSEHADPRIGAYTLQYARLFETIGWLYVYHIRNQRYEFPGANVPSDNDDIFRWSDVFQPIGSCPPVKTTRESLGSSRVKITDLFFSGMGRFLNNNIVYQPNFRSALDRRKSEWKELLNITHSPYVAFHMRRTDKVGTESAYSSAVQYLSHMLVANGQIWPKRIFVMTDDPRAVDELKRFVPHGEVEVCSAAEITRAVKLV